MIKEALTFDDVLLVPQKSNYSPSKVSTTIKLGKNLELKIPILSAAMDTVTESKMAIELGKLGALGIIHKNLTPEKQAEEVKKVKSKNLKCGAAISVGQDSLKRADKLIAAGVDLLVIDVAHGHFYKVAETVRKLKKKYSSKILIVGGNVATGKATSDLIKAGADIIKIGVGPGSICTTRVIAGIGVPQLTAVMEAVKVARKTKTPVIADGGIKYSGDMVKALASGANAIMIGSLLSGTDEAPGKILFYKGKKYKIYRGMGSIDAMQKGSKDRYMQENKKNKKDMIAEGVVGYTEYKGKVSDIVNQLVGGLKQGLGYCGAKNIEDLWKKAEFVKISNAGLVESHPHNLSRIKKAPNY